MIVKGVKLWAVLGYGSDCDGYNSGSCNLYSIQAEAERAADESNKFSDGILYGVTDSWNDVLDYCLNFDKDTPDYYWEHNEIINLP